MGVRFSVIVPAYNAERFIDKALASVFSQDYPPHEIIVINDGSKDGTEEILRGYGDRIRFKTVPNGGVSAARNVGIRMATGDYLAFLDADDIWFKPKLRVNAELIDRYPMVGCIFSDYVERVAFYGNRLKLRSEMVGHQDRIAHDRPLPFHALKLFLFYDYGSTPSAVVAKKKLVESAGYFDEKRRLVEDLEFYLRMALESQMIVSSRNLLYKFNHPQNLSANNMRMLEARIQAFEDFHAAHRDFIRDHGFEHGIRRSVARVLYMMGDLSYEDGQRKKAFDCYLRAFKRCPTAGNLWRFSSKATMKAVRLATMDLISRKRLQGGS